MHHKDEMELFNYKGVSYCSYMYEHVLHSFLINVVKTCNYYLTTQTNLHV